jgi:hypothetical protein
MRASTEKIPLLGDHRLIAPNRSWSKSIVENKGLSLRAEAWHGIAPPSAQRRFDCSMMNHQQG